MFLCFGVLSYPGLPSGALHFLHTHPEPFPTSHYNSCPPILTSVLTWLPARRLALSITSHSCQSIVSYYAKSATTAYGPITVVRTIGKSIAGHQKRGGRLYATNCKRGKECLTRTHNTTYQRPSISRYRVCLVQDGKQCRLDPEKCSFSAVRWII